MRKRFLTLVGLVVFVAGVCRGGDLPPIRTVFLILLENYPWSSMKGNTNAPYLNNTLLPMSSYCEQYYCPSNYTCSLLSYLWLEAGTAFGISSLDPSCDDPPAVNHQSTTNHLVSLLNRAGISWKTYQEGASATQLLFDNSGFYAVRHNPFVYFDDTTGTNDPNNAYGLAHIRPYSEMTSDLTNNAIARYNFLTPNVCNDMHDSCAPYYNPIRQGDAWLAAEIPKILNSSAYGNNGAIFITWDDPDITNAVPIGMIVLSPLSRGHGYISTNRYTHSSTLRTMEEIFHVRPFLGGAADATNLSELFVEANTNTPGNMAITSFALLSGGQLELTVTGLVADVPLILEDSTDLAGWTPLATNFAAGGTPSEATVTNTAGSGYSRHFYRFRQVLP